MAKKRAASRRDFLRGRLSLEAGGVPSQGDPESGLAKPILQSKAQTQANYLQHFSKRAMACDFELFFNLNQHEGSAVAAAEAFELIDRLEAQLSVYRESSEVSQMNKVAGSESFTASPVVRELLQRSLDLFRTTQGAFDVTSTPLSDVWGFNNREARVPSEQELEEALRRVDSEQILVSDCQVRFGLPELMVNFNSIGKGYAVDRAAETICEQWVDNFVIHGGQSSVAARGSESIEVGRTQATEAESVPDQDEQEHRTVGLESSDSESDSQSDLVPEVDPDAESDVEQMKDLESLESGWTVGLSHPFVPGLRLAEITLRNQSLSTSGTARQGFFHKGRRYGHIIDPRTGWPTDHNLSATVICDSTALSDALATAFFVMKLEEVEAFCETHPEVAAILILPKSKSGGVTIETFNLPVNTLTLCSV